MQAIRQRILEQLKTRGKATVVELAADVDMAPVSVRHHLDILEGDGLIRVAELRRGSGAGRPQQLYELTEAAESHFPHRYQDLAVSVLSEVKAVLPPAAVGQMVCRLASATAAEAPLPEEGQTFEQRLDQITDFLTEKGYLARWEKSGDTYRIDTLNCPYAGIVNNHHELCEMDLHIVTDLLDVIPLRSARIVEGDHACSYCFKAPTSELKVQS